MNLYTFRLATVTDEDAIVRLNEASVEATSPMDGARFRTLFNLCSLALVAECDSQVIGFLMGFTPGSSYDSPNYRWFCERLQRFFYVDRIVISQTCRGSGLGDRFYKQVRSWAQDAQLHWLAAELNLEPPNVESLRFHERNGFCQVGVEQLPSGKRVSMQIRTLTDN